MPKIVIKEIDKTASNLITSNGFSVVVPGFVKPGKRPKSDYDYGVDDNGKSVFDENNIYICNSKTAFERYIGRVGSVDVEAKAPTISIRKEPFEFIPYYSDDQFTPIGDMGGGRLTGNTIKIENTEYIELEIYNYEIPLLDNTLVYINEYGQGEYIALYNNEGEQLSLNNKFIEANINFNNNPILDIQSIADLSYGKVTAQEFYETYKDNLYIREKALEGTTSEGYLCKYIDDKYYTYSKATSWDSETPYSLILSGDEGNDAINTLCHYGNQIADMLLGLGYTVLYLRLKTIGDLTREDDEGKTKFEPLKDRSIYNFRYIISGLIDDVESVKVEDVNGIINNIASYINDKSLDENGRGDCIALTDIAKTTYKEKPSISAVEAIKNCDKQESTYAAYFAPTVLLEVPDDAEYDNNKEFPASVFYLACAATSFKRYPEWFAVSGYTRGVSPYKVLGTSVKLGDTAVNILQPRSIDEDEEGVNKTAVNLIVNLNNNYYLWGNRTAYTLGRELVASHFLNIRQLCCTLKKAIYNTCRSLTFDPNTEILWLNFCNSLRPLLENMKNNQGIKDYKFEKKNTDIKAKLFAAIRIIPIEAVEDFEIGLTLENDFDETLITIEETLLN